jgi:hypothetical protein
LHSFFPRQGRVCPPNHLSPILWKSCWPPSRMRRGAAPGVASEVEGAGGRSAIWFPRSGPRSLHAVAPGAGHRFDYHGKVAYEPLHQTGGASRRCAVYSLPPRRLLSLVV